MVKKKKASSVLLDKISKWWFEKENSSFQNSLVKWQITDTKA